RRPFSRYDAMKSKASASLRYLLAAALAATGSMAQAVRPSAHWPPAFVHAQGDNFNGAVLDLSKWMYRTDVRAENSRRSENVRLENTCLVIAMKKEAGHVNVYTGGGEIS